MHVWCGIEVFIFLQQLKKSGKVVLESCSEGCTGYQVPNR